MDTLAASLPSPPSTSTSAASQRTRAPQAAREGEGGGFGAWLRQSLDAPNADGADKVKASAPPSARAGKPDGPTHPSQAHGPSSRPRSVHRGDPATTEVPRASVPDSPDGPQHAALRGREDSDDTVLAEGPTVLSVDAQPITTGVLTHPPVEAGTSAIDAEPQERPMASAGSMTRQDPSMPLAKATAAPKPALAAAEAAEAETSSSQALKATGAAPAAAAGPVLGQADAPAKSPVAAAAEAREAGVVGKETEDAGAMRRAISEASMAMASARAPVPPVESPVSPSIAAGGVALPAPGVATSMPGIASATPALTAGAEAYVATSPQDPTFAPAFGARITTLVKDGIERASIRLNPAEMGPVAVKLAIEGQQVRVEMAADLAATRQVLEQALPSLAGALRDAGFTLSGGGVFQQPPQSREGSSGDDSSRERRNGQDDALTVEVASAGHAGTHGPRGLVDVFA